MRVGYLGPEGTFSHEAVLSDVDHRELELVAQPTIYDTVMAVHEGAVERALVPIENSLEGSVNTTLDTLAGEAEDVAIAGEVVHPIRHCLIARNPMALEDIDAIVSHPHAHAQCARFIRAELREGVTVVAAASTADAVRRVAEHEGGGTWAALGNRLSAEIYECEVIRAGVEDVAGNETRFVWLAPAGEQPEREGRWKTSVVFWGVGADAPGWLVRCLSEFAFRGVNLTKIESRPRRQGLGRYMFFVDLEGSERDAPVAEAIAGLHQHAEELRVLGSYPVPG